MKRRFFGLISQKWQKTVPLTITLSVALLLSEADYSIQKMLGRKLSENCYSNLLLKP